MPDRQLDDLPYDAVLASHELAAADPRLGEVIAAVGPPTLTIRPDETVAALLRSIVYQQLSGKAAATIHGRVLVAFGDGHQPDVDALEGADTEALRACGLSRAKVAAVQDLVQRQLDGSLPTREALLDLDDEAIVGELTKVRGVGPWTAQMLLMFNLGRPNIWPSADLGVQEGYRLIAGAQERLTARELATEGERYRPWRSVAAWYLWRAVDLHRAAAV